MVVPFRELPQNPLNSGLGIIKGSLVANFRYTNFWVAGEE